MSIWCIFHSTTRLDWRLKNNPNLFFLALLWSKERGAPRHLILTTVSEAALTPELPSPRITPVPKTLSYSQNIFGLFSAFKTVLQSTSGRIKLITNQWVEEDKKSSVREEVSGRAAKREEGRYVLKEVKGMFHNSRPHSSWRSFAKSAPLTSNK